MWLDGDICTAIRPFHTECKLCNATDCGVCSWPCKVLALGKFHPPLFFTDDWCIPVKSKMGWSAVVFCACEIVQLFSVVFCVVSAVYEFDLGINVKETPNKRWPVDSGPCSDTDSCFYIATICFSPTVVAIECLHTHAVRVNCILVIEGHYYGNKHKL